MAAVTYVAPRLATPSTEARIRRGEANVAISPGQAVAISGTAPSSGRFETRVILATSEATMIGIALNKAAAGDVVEFVIDGEVSGYSGLTPGARLSVVNGVLDSTAPEGDSRIVAYNATTVTLV